MLLKKRLGKTLDSSVITIPGKAGADLREILAMILESEEALLEIGMGHVGFYEKNGVHCVTEPCTPEDLHYTAQKLGITYIAIYPLNCAELLDLCPNCKGYHGGDGN